MSRVLYIQPNFFCEINFAHHAGNFTLTILIRGAMIRLSRV
uniref:Uncharacterized protein LOC106774508 n=1 Tax=Rhizophora mucronata TaxID=61149 RepID=A0A2P2KBZ8_RHIMU